MTDEQRLDRLERIVKLMIKAGLRARRHSSDQDEKINILIDSQIRNDEKLAALAVRTDERFAALAESQTALTHAVERLISERGNGQSQP